MVCEIVAQERLIKIKHLLPFQERRINWTKFRLLQNPLIRADTELVTGGRTENECGSARRA